MHQYSNIQDTNIHTLHLQSMVEMQIEKKKAMLKTLHMCKNLTAEHSK